MQLGKFTIDKWKVVVLIFLASFTFLGYSWQKKNNDFSYVIRSDGSGYYAYLPSFFLYGDPTFEQARQVEAVYHNGNVSKNYIFRTRDGASYNKYFPGIAILQLPFFLLACLFAKLSGAPVDGYSSFFQFFFWIGSLTYTLTGIVLWIRLLKRYLNQKSETVSHIVMLLCLSTPIVFYGFYTPSFTHGYSLFLIALFFNVLLKLRDRPTAKRFAFLGLVLGLILLLRPTNLVVVLAIPLIWNSRIDFFSWIKSLFVSHFRKLILFLVLFFVTISCLFLSWKWQTGHWFIWSYSGEGFDFLHPSLLSALLSFRMGLLLHTPVLVLAIAGWFVWFRKNRYQAIWWAVYAMINCWIIFSWWCWDYESSFGNRPFTEHILLLSLPLFFLFKKLPKLILTGVVLFALLGSIRLYTYTIGMVGDQRFTKDSYFASLRFWDEGNSGRWFFSKACEPHGEVRNSWDLLLHNEVIKVTAKDEFVLTAEFDFPKQREGERFFVRADFEKRLLSEKRFENVFLVIDVFRDGSTERYYRAMDLFNDREEGRNQWKSLTFESEACDYLEEYERLKVYIWNPGKQDFQLRNAHFVVQAYR